MQRYDKSVKVPNIFLFFLCHYVKELFSCTVFCRALLCRFVLYVYLSCHAVGNEPLLIFLQIAYL